MKKRKERWPQQSKYIAETFEIMHILKIPLNLVAVDIEHDQHGWTCMLYTTRRMMSSRHDKRDIDICMEVDATNEATQQQQQQQRHQPPRHTRSTLPFSSLPFSIHTEYIYYKINKYRTFVLAFISRPPTADKTNNRCNTNHFTMQKQRMKDKKKMRSK